MSNSPGRNLKERMSPSASIGLDRDTMSQQNAASPESLSVAPDTISSSTSTSSSDSKSGSAPKMMQGTVKWFNDAKGFGFIEHDSGRDVFVHYSVIETEGFKTLKDGEIVFYSLAEGDKGLHAGRVLRDPSVVKAPKAKAADGTELNEGSLSDQVEVASTGSSLSSSGISASTIKESQSTNDSTSSNQSDQE